MAGILDYFGDPANQGLIGMATGLLQAGGPSPFPRSFGQALGGGFQGMMQGQHAALANQLMNQQVQGLTFANKRAEAQAGILDRYLSGAGGAGIQSGPTLPTGTPAGISPATLQGAFPGMPPDEAASLSASNTGAPPVNPQASYFNPQQLFQQGQLFLAAGLPGGAEMMNAAVSHDPSLRAPVAVRPGGSLVSATGQNIYTAPNIPTGMQMSGGQAQNIPNFISSLAQQEQTKAGTHAMYGVHPMTAPSGAVTPTFGFNLPGWPGMPGAGVTPPAAPASPPAPAPRPFSPPKPNPNDPWSTIPKIQQPTGMGQSTFQKGVAEQQSKAVGELTTRFGEISTQATQRKAFNDQALGLVDQADTGPKAALIGDIKNWLTSRLGVPESDFENTPSATIALQKDLVNAATQKAKQQFGSRITQSEVQLMLQRASPGVDMTKAAIKYLIQSDNAQIDYQLKQGSDLGKYLKDGGDPLQFESWYAKSFPMSKAIGAVHLPKPNEQAPQTFADKPPAKDYRGKRIRDTQTGTFFESDGMGWKEVK